MALRIAKIVSKSDQKIIRLNELRDRLVNLGYPNLLINNAIEKAIIVPPHYQDVELSKSVLTFVSDHGDMSSSMYNDKMKPFIDNIILTAQGNFELPQVKRCSRQPPNILRFLNSRSIYSTKKCHKPTCKICHNMLERETCITINNIKINFNANMNCCSENVIYVILCNICDIFYVGHSVCEHRNCTHNIHITEHLRECGFDFSIIPVYKARDSCEYVLSYLQKTFVHSLEFNLR